MLFKIQILRIREFVRQAMARARDWMIERHSSISQHRQILQYVLPFILIGIVVLMKIFLNDVLDLGGPYLLLYGTIMLSGWYGGFGPAVVAIILSVGVVDFYFYAPGSLFTVDTNIEIVRIIFFALEGLFISALSEVMHKALIKVANQKQQIDVITKDLAETNTKLNETLDNISDGLISVDTDLMLIFANKNAAKLFGRAQQEITGCKLNDVDKQIFVGSLYDALVTAVQDKKQLRLEHYVTALDKWFKINIYPSPQGLAIYMRDMTEEKREESERKRQQKYYERLVSSDVVGIVMADNNGVIVDANNAFLKLLGYSKNDIYGGKLSLRDITPPEFAALDQQILAEVTENGVSKSFEKEYIRIDSSRVDVILGAVMLDEQKGVSLYYVIDNTERRDQERRKDEFISIASHELKTPLTSIKAFTQLVSLRAKDIEDPKLARYTNRLLGQTNKLVTIVTDLLDVSRIQTHRLQLNQQWVDVHKLLKDAINSLQILNHTHKLVLSADIDRLIYIDSTRVEQVLINLVNNATKYSPESKQIDITATETPTEVIIGVRDYGIGIAKSEQDKIFTAFYRVDETDKDRFFGLGLGLHISQEIISRHGGRIWVESELNKGSTFYFSLPIEHE